MILYNTLLFLHVAAVTIWLGSGFLLHFLAWRAERAGDTPAMMTALAQMGSLGNCVFVPSSLATLVFGIGMVLVAGWSFDELWIVLGLAGYAVSFGIGAFMLKPRGEAIGAMMASEGITPAAVAKGRQLAMIGRVEAVVLYFVVAVMALKPAVNDIAVLAGLAAGLAIGMAFAVLGARQAVAQAAAA